MDSNSEKPAPLVGSGEDVRRFSVIRNGECLLNTNNGIEAMKRWWKEVGSFVYDNDKDEIVGHYELDVPEIDP